ncbi:MAG: DNA polymerase III subunit gamma/tau [Clostridia bacterium]|nr:DNA polymerase III subunit gamma/tau [Clostridia bacterium]
MANRLALYRQFRPLIFDDVIGQNEITSTIKNQVWTQNKSHAYLFSGTRGTGKTSTAKILTRAVNCQENDEGNPCNQCDACKSILDDSNIDVIEMDAASNNGVDNIRSLKDAVQFTPANSKYKVYIIDEVHMLSQGAFNALLKTLEEPPARVLFILATTELHKIPATIRSRCQIFNFKRVSEEAMITRMQFILGEIGAVAETNALKLIASNSEGAMRDALSILDQCVSRNSRVREEDVKNMLGVMNIELVFSAATSIINYDSSGALSILEVIISNGKSFLQFIDSLINIFRDLMLYKSSNSAAAIKNTDEYIGNISSLANNTAIENIISILKKLSQIKNKISFDINPRVRVEMSLIGLTNPSFSDDFNSILARLKKVEEAICEMISKGSIIETKRILEIIEIKQTLGVDIEALFDSAPVKNFDNTKSYQKSQMASIKEKIKKMEENEYNKESNQMKAFEDSHSIYINDDTNNDCKINNSIDNFNMYDTKEFGNISMEKEMGTESINILEEVKKSLSEELVLGAIAKNVLLNIEDDCLYIKTEIPGYIILLDELKDVLSDIATKHSLSYEYSLV